MTSTEKLALELTGRVSLEPLHSHRDEQADGFIKGRVSIILPAYNEAKCIRKSVEDIEHRFRNHNLDYEIIVVDDGSTDNTRAVVQEFSERVKLVTYSRNQGKGHALKAGFKLATGQFTLLVDGDSEVHPNEILTYLRALDKVDFAIGSKRHKKSKVRTPVMRRFLSLSFNIIERLLTGVKARDTQAGLKAARTTSLYRILPLLSVKRYAFDAELLAVATLLDYGIEELPVDIDLNASFSTRQVVRMLIDLLGITYRLRVTRWYQKNAVVMANTYDPILAWQ
jgi:glycosyltransferase involved in cell wall biosynthesis